MKKKNVYIIAGSNGSGKTTFASMFLPEYVKCDRFINADLIALGLSPFSPQQHALKAGKLVLQQIKDYMNQGIDFSFETTMSGLTYLRYLQMLKEHGYKIHIFFLWIPDTHLAVARVQTRVEQGGHNVPVVDIQRRFARSAENFFKRYRPLADQWILFNNAQMHPILISKKQNSHIEVMDRDLFVKITQDIGVDL